MLNHLDSVISAWISGLDYPLETLLRLLLAAVAGGIIGIERELRGRQAGFRTNMLVCFGAALVMIVSNALAMHDWSHHPAGFTVSVDPARIAYGVMVGIGFLGGGVIMHERGKIQGVTTAAAIWCVAAIGLAAGLGMYKITVIATGIVMLALTFLRYLETALPAEHYAALTIRRKWHPDCINNLIKRLESHGLDATDISFDRHDDDNVYIEVHVSFSSRHKFNILHAEIIADPELELIAAKNV